MNRPGTSPYSDQARPMPMSALPPRTTWTDLAPVADIDPDIAARARLVVAGRARDVPDCSELLAMLGLLDPTPTQED